jgi:hypothetical protein
VNNAPQSAFDVMLSNGVVIHFDAGSMLGSSDPQPAQGDDAYLDSSSNSISIASTSGGNFEALDISSTASVQINDTIDTTVVTLNNVSALENVPLVYTASVNNAPQSAFDVMLSNGVVIHFDAGSMLGSSAPQPAQGDDAYLDASSSSISIASTSGGNFEALDISSTASVQISDTIDTTVVTLNNVSALENAPLVYTASVNNAPQSAFDVMLSNGVVIHFDAGSMLGSSAPQPAQGDDAYLDASSSSISIASTSGGNFEALDISSTASVQISDTIDTTVVTLNNVSALENAPLVYTASVNNAPQSAFDVMLSNGVVIHFDAGSMLGSSAPQPAQGDDAYLDSSSNSISIASTSGGNFEALDISSTASVIISDTLDTTIVTLNNVNVVEGSAFVYSATVNNSTQTAMDLMLSNGVVIHFNANSSTGFSAQQTAPADYGHINASDTPISIVSAIGGNFEALDISSVANLHISDAASSTVITLNDVNTVEGGAAYIYTATVSNAPQNTPLEVVLSNGVIIHFDVGSMVGSSDLQNSPSNDMYNNASDTQISILSASGGNFDSLDISSTANLHIGDILDTTVVTLNNVSALENAPLVYTASLNNAPQSAFDVMLSNGVVIHFDAGSMLGSSAPQPAQGDDTYLDSSSNSISIASTSGGNFEALDISSTASVQINDTIDTYRGDFKQCQRIRKCAFSLHR